MAELDDAVTRIMNLRRGAPVDTPEEQDVEDSVGFNPQANLRGMREEVEREFGQPAQLPVDEPGEIRTALDLFRLDPENKEVDVQSGLSASDRFSLAVRRGKNQERYLDDQFGVGGWRRSRDGRLVVEIDGKEILGDEIGMSWRDVVDAADTAQDVGVGLAAAGTTAATGGGPFAVATFGALATAMAGSIKDLVVTVGPVNTKRGWEIFKDRGAEAAFEFFTGIVPAMVGKQLSRAPVDSGQLTPNDAKSAVARLKERTGVEVNLTSAQATGSPTLGRIENIGEKLPQSAETFKAAAQDQELALREAQAALLGDAPGGTGRLTGEVNRQSDAAFKEVVELNKKLDDTMMARLDEIGDVRSEAAKDLDLPMAGMKLRTGHNRLRDTWVEKNRELYDKVDNLPGGSERVVFPGAINEAGMELDDLPIKEYFPASVKQKIRAAMNQEAMTLREARNARSFINDTIAEGEALGGADTAVLRRISKAFSKDIDSAKAKLDPETAQALTEANAYYASQVERWLEPGVVESFVPSTSRGFVENADLAKRIFHATDPAKVERALKDLTDDEVRMVGRSAWNEMIRQNQEEFPIGTISPTKLRNFIMTAPSRVLEKLFSRDGTIASGKKVVGEVNGVLEAMNAARAGRSGGGKAMLLELDLSRGIPDDLAGVIRTAAIKERRAVRDFKSGPLKAFVKDENGRTELPSEDFVKHIAGLDDKDVAEVVARFNGLGGDALATLDDLKKETIEFLLKSGSRPASQGEVISGVIEPGQQFLHGPSLTEVIEKVGEKKLKTLIGPEALQGLKDVATVRTAQSIKQASAAGGLIAGAIITGLMRAPIATLPIIAQYKVLSMVLTNPVIAKTLGKTKGKLLRPAARPGELAALAAASQQVFKVVDEVAQDPDVVNEFRIKWNKAMGIEFEAPESVIDDAVGRIMKLRRQRNAPQGVE